MNAFLNSAAGRSRIVVLGMLSLLIVALPACVFHVGGGSWHHSYSSDDAKYRETREFEVAHVPGSAIRVSTKMGSVRVRRGDVDAVRIVAKLRCKTEDRLERTEIVAERTDGGDLRVRVEWPNGKRKDAEGCSFEITVPDARGVEVRSTYGAVSLAGLKGKASVETSYGQVRIDHHDGAVDADTSFGGIEMSEIAGPIDVRTSYGGVAVRMTEDNPGPVRIDTSFGGVDLEAGSAFRGGLSMKTSFGDVKVTGAGASEVPVRYLSKGRTSAKVHVGDDDAASSRIDTSYGGIHVRFGR